jgi:hypothetical protein
LRFVQAYKNGSTNEEYGILAESNFGINPEKRERERERERDFMGEWLRRTERGL